MHQFNAELRIIDGNPYVFLPEDILRELFSHAGKNKGPIPVQGTCNDVAFQQTLMKFRGAWRLYINMKMLPDSPRRIGEVLTIFIEFDPSDRTIQPHPKLVRALQANEEARRVFEGLSPSLQKEIVRYISNLKQEESIDRNVKRAINFLLGNERFVGRDSPVKN